MICFATHNTEVKVTALYKFHNKNSRKFFTASKFSHRRFRLTKNSNTPLMFVRAPKHFKAGKQRVVFFNGIYRAEKYFPSNAGYFLFAGDNLNSIYSFNNFLGTNFTKPDMQISSYVLETTLSFRIIIHGWSFTVNYYF